MTRRAVVISNDVIPGMGVPVAAPGLRAWGLAAGLRAGGLDTTIIIPQEVSSRQWVAGLPLVAPRGAVLVPRSAYARYLKQHRADVVVISNANSFPSLPQVRDFALIMDFFAPKLLESQAHGDDQDRPHVYRELRERVDRTLAAADLVLLNGEKKRNYVLELYRAQLITPPPLMTVPMCLPAQDTPIEVSDSGPLRGIISGYRQPWMRDAKGMQAVRDAVKDELLEVTALTGQHRAVANADPTTDEGVPIANRLSLQRYPDFIGSLRRCEMAIDVFAPNVERRLAMVTRSVVAICAGLPVIHPSFTEVGPLVERSGAGWTIDPDDVDDVATALRHAHDDRTELQRRAEAALELAHTTFDPRKALESTVDWAMKR